MSYNIRYTGDIFMGVFSANSILTPEFDYNFLLGLLKDYRRPIDKISELIKGGGIIRVKKGIYIAKDRAYSNFVLANLIYGPSYVSKESALSFYGLIPEGVFQTTSITTGRKKHFNTPVGVFIYTHLPIAAYSEGVSVLKIDDKRQCLIASKEKALADRVYSEKFKSVEEIEEFLIDGLRIERSELAKFRINEMGQIKRAFKKKSVNLLFDFLRGLK